MPSAISMVFCSSRSCGCTVISNCSVTRSSCASRRAIEISWQRPAEDRLADRAAGLGEHLDRLVGRHVAGAELHLGDRAVVAPQEAHQQLGEIAARVAVDPAHDAEIDRHDAAAGGRRRCCRRACRHGRSRRGTPGRRRPRRTCCMIGVGIVAGGDDGVAVVDRHAVDPLLGHHALRGAVPVDRGRAVVGIVGEILAQLLRPRRPPCAGPSRPAPRRRRPCTDLDRPQAAEARLGALDQLGHPVEEVEIAREGRLDAGPQHLDRDRPAVGR